MGGASQRNRCPCETTLLAFAVTALEWNHKAVMRPTVHLRQPFWYNKAQARCMVQHSILVPFHDSYIGTDPARWLTASQPYEVRSLDAKTHL